MITLTRIELLMAILAGANRRIKSTTDNRKDSAGYKDKDGWDVDIEGAAAELAYAKYRNEF